MEFYWASVISNVFKREQRVQSYQERKGIPEAEM